MGLYRLKGFPATGKLAGPLNKRAFVGSNLPTRRDITSGLPVIRPESMPTAAASYNPTYRELANCRLTRPEQMSAMTC
jgi:hypothetical protein